MTWGHRIEFLYRKGRVRATCVPHGASSRWGTDAEARAWCDMHTGLKEKGTRVTGEARQASRGDA